MKNIKVLAAIWVALAASEITVAQQNSTSGFYVKAYGGYGFLTPGSFKLTGSSGTQFTIGSTGLGKGVHFGGGLGYILNDLLNVGVDADYLQGAKLSANSTYFGGLGTGMSNSAIDYSILSIIPNVTFKAISKPDYLIYTRIGIILTASTKSTMTIHDSSDFVTNNPSEIIAVDSTVNFSYGVNVGAQAALGVQFNINEHLRAFGEIFGNFLAITPSSSTNAGVRRYYDGGNNYLSSSSNTTNFTYKKSGDVVNNVLPATEFNTNSIGVNIGVTYRF